MVVAAWYPREGLGSAANVFPLPSSANGVNRLRELPGAQRLTGRIAILAMECRCRDGMTTWETTALASMVPCLRRAEAWGHDRMTRSRGAYRPT